jgi:recombination protein RecR
MYPKSFKKLIDYFASLPSVGPKMAERLVLYLFKQEKDMLSDFGKSLAELKHSLSYCTKCGNISENDLCSICRDSSRDQAKICVVEDPLDVIAIEKTKKYTGLYHILGGTLSTVKKNNQSDLKINELQKRISNQKIQEIILATNPTTEGDATALYIARIVKPLGVKVTRLGRGLSTGGDIEYADELTLGSAIMNRK